MKTMRLLLILLIVASSLTACGVDVPANSGETIGKAAGQQKASDLRVVSSWSPRPDQCSDPSFPIPLEVWTDVDEERGYLANVVTCTDEARSGLWMHNIGNEIWIVSANGAWHFQASTSASNVFAEAFDYPSILVPGDELAIDSSPDQVSWKLAKRYTIAWETYSEGIDRLKSYGQTAVESALKRHGTPAQAALTSCALTAFNIADEWMGDPEGFADNFGSVLTTGSGASSCATQWKSAWSERFKPTAQFLEDADNSFRWFHRLGRTLVILTR